MAKKDAASKRLAEEIALAELLKKVPPLFTLEELPAPPAPEELPALLQLGVPGLGSYARDIAQKPILDAFKEIGYNGTMCLDLYGYPMPVRELEGCAARMREAGGYLGID